MGDEITMIFRNKKGALVLRDVFFIIIIMMGVMIFATLFVADMADNYDNDNMKAEWAGSSLNNTGGNLLFDLINDTEDMQNATLGGESGGIIGFIENIDEKVQGLGKVIGVVFGAPIYFGNAVEGVLLELKIPQPFPFIISKTIAIVLYAIIIFTIVAAVLKGGKI